MDGKLKKRVMIIDDDSEFDARLSDKIREKGMEPVTALTGKEALDYLSQNEVDFIILDFVMPEMDGYTFYHILKRDMRKNIPTVVLTSLSGAQDTEDLEVYIKAETNLDEFVDRIRDRLS